MCALKSMQPCRSLRYPDVQGLGFRVRAGFGGSGFGGSGFGVLGLGFVACGLLSRLQGSGI